MLLKVTHDGDDAPPAPWKYKGITRTSLTDNANEDG
jgi:hypothetical protein